MQCRFMINLIYWKMYLWGTPNPLSLCEKCIFAGSWWMWMCLVTKSSYSILNIEFNLRLAGLGWAGQAGLVRSSYNFVGELCCCFCWSLVAAWSSLSNTLTVWAKMAEPELVLGVHFTVRTWLSQTTARWVWENTWEHARDIADINI